MVHDEPKVEVGIVIYLEGEMERAVNLQFALLVLQEQQVE